MRDTYVSFDQLPDFAKTILHASGMRPVSIPVTIGEQISVPGNFHDGNVRKIYFNRKGNISMVKSGFGDSAINHSKQEAFGYGGFKCTLVPGDFIFVTNSHRNSAELYAHPADINRDAIAPPVDLTYEEKIVLWATRSLKSSYAGISNYRFHEAQQFFRINRHQWEQAKGDAIRKGWLNKAGAITTAGRNLAAKLDQYRIREEHEEFLKSIKKEA